MMELARFYPIAPNADWVERLAALGAKTIQLRIKDQSEPTIRDWVRRSLATARRYSSQLVVNDYWRVAIEEGAEFIHLGQEDLASADLKAIRLSEARIGVSTHDEVELEIALAAGADYVALGPIYETKLKAMRFSPQGLDRIRDWRGRIGERPMVAIGGITIERAPGVMASGADSVAVITDFLTHPDPDARIASWIRWGSEANEL